MWMERGGKDECSILKSSGELGRQGEVTFVLVGAEGEECSNILDDLFARKEIPRDTARARTLRIS